MSLVHWIYLAIVLAVIVTMLLKRGVVLVTTLGIFIVGAVYTGSLIGGIQTLFKAFLSAGMDLFDIMLIIAVMVAMLKSMEAMGADYLMIAPVQKWLKRPTIAFFALGLIMYATALFFWPTPSTALVGTILVPVAIKQGLTPMAAAMSVNILGHGMALSGDLVLQGAAKITSGAAGIEVGELLYISGILSVVTGAVAITVAYLLMRKEMILSSEEQAKLSKVQEEKQRQSRSDQEKSKKEEVCGERKFCRGAQVIALGVPGAFLTAIVVMGFTGVSGGDASALLGGIAIVFVIINSLLQYGDRALEEMEDYLKEGFLFAMKIFSTVIPIAGFFFLGSPGNVTTILGKGAPGFLFDLGQAFSKAVPLSTIPVAFGILLVGLVTGMGGSGFSGLPLIGALSRALGDSIGINVAALAAIGQMGAIWSGGGTLTAWAFGLVATAGIAGVSPMELARKNFLPVMAGLVVATVVGILLM